MTSIHIQMMTSSVTPGGQINGFIYVNSNSFANCNQIYVNVTGFEEAKFTKEESLTYNEYERYIERKTGEKRPFFSMFDYNHPLDQLWYRSRIASRGNINEDYEKRYIPVVYDESSEVFHKNFLVYSFPHNDIPAGQYSFPFSFKLPNYLPSSFSYKWSEFGENNYAVIKYQMIAFIPPTGVSNFKNNFLHD